MKDYQSCSSNRPKLQHLFDAKGVCHLLFTINFLAKELSNQRCPKFTSKARALRHTFLKDGRDRTERLATGFL